MKRITIFILLALSLISFAQENSEGKFSGYMMGDYYYNISHNNEALIDQHGFWFRRIYFTYDYKIDSEFSTRLRLEMNNDGKYTSAVTMVPVVKDAYLAYKFGNQKAYVGISSTPTFGLIEKIWGYRSVEKTPLDQQRMASSRDFGLSIKGKLDKSGKIGYHVMYGNGSGNKQEIDKGKSFMGSINYWLSKEIVVQLYGDYADRAGQADTYIGQGFLGYQSKKINGGVHYSYQILKAKDDSVEDISLNLFSVFISGNVAEKIKLIGRIDRMFDPNPVGNKVAYTPFDNSASFTLVILGVDYKVAKDVSIIPNVEYVIYDENDLGVTPTNDIYGRITFFWKFK
jgi:hypothetical protein